MAHIKRLIATTALIAAGTLTTGLQSAGADSHSWQGCSFTGSDLANGQAVSVWVTRVAYCSNMKAAAVGTTASGTGWGYPVASAIGGGNAISTSHLGRGELGTTYGGKVHYR